MSIGRTSTSPLYLKRFKTPKLTSPIAFFLLVMFLLLSALGFLNLISAAPNADVISKQGYAFLLGISVIGIIGWLVPIRIIEELAPYFVAVILLLLLAVLLFGDVAGGARRWLSFGSWRLQPSELAKMAVALAVARFFKQRSGQEEFGILDLAPLLLLLAVIFGLIFIQPDFGTAGICLLIAAFQFLLIPVKRSTLAVGALTAVAASWVGWKFILLDYQKLRVINFFNPDFDPSGTGYNSLQSLVAIGSGGLFGKGFMNGTQAHLRFLPERHTDFAFSVFAEEHGFWVCLILFAAFVFLTLTGLAIARRARDAFAQLLALGVVANLFVQFAINVAMVLGAFPIVGVTLPFFSYGGSSMLSGCIKIGILVAVERENAGYLKRSYQLKS